MISTAMTASIKDFSRKQWDPFLNNLNWTQQNFQIWRSNWYLYCKGPRDRGRLPRKRFSESAWSHCRAQIGLTYKINFFCGHTKIVDTDSMILYDSARKTVIICGWLMLQDSRYRKQGSGHRATERPLLIKTSYFPTTIF